MKYIIIINQQILSKTNLDIVDGAILDYIKFYCGSQNEKIKKQRIIEKKETWTWIDYSTLLKDMPLLKIKNTGAITRRITRIEENGYIKTKRFKHAKKYFKITAKFDELLIDVNSPIDTGQQPYSPVSIDAIDTGQPIKNKYNKEEKLILSANADEKLNSTVDQIIASMNSKKKTIIFNSKDAIEKTTNDKQKHVQVVGIYWKWLGWDFENKEQYKSALGRDLKAASALKGYSLNRIKRTFKKLDGDSNNGEKFAWNLNTVHKTIDNIK